MLPTLVSQPLIKIQLKWISTIQEVYKRKAALRFFAQTFSIAAGLLPFSISVSVSAETHPRFNSLFLYFCLSISIHKKKSKKKKKKNQTKKFIEKKTQKKEEATVALHRKPLFLCSLLCLYSDCARTKKKKQNPVLTFLLLLSLSSLKEEENSNNSLSFDLFVTS